MSSSFPVCAPVYGRATSSRSSWSRSGNPVSGAEVTPGTVLPQGIIFKRGDFASAKTLCVPRLGIDCAGTYAAVAPFEYAGP